MFSRLTWLFCPEDCAYSHLLPPKKSPILPPMIASLKARAKYKLDSVFWWLVERLVPIHLAPPPQGTVLVVAPHPDDETFACGATIARLNAQRTNIHIVIISDGSNSTRQEGKTKSALAKIRKTEARGAIQALGLPEKQVTFLNYSDGSLEKAESIIMEELSHIIEIKKPSLIFAPHAIDAHPDHKILATIIDKLKLPCLCYRYIVWVQTKRSLANLMKLAFTEHQIRIPMKKFKERKALAIDCYLSQTGGTNYQHGKGFLHPSFISLFLKEEEVFFTK